MQNLAAKLSSRLLPFPNSTLKALEEDEISLDSVIRGKFTAGRTRLAWLACGPQLEVTNSVTGERLSAYQFHGVTERPPTVVAVKEFFWQKKTGLLVGLVEAEGSILCLYDVGISKVVKAVVLPGSVTAIEPIVNHGGASASTQHLHQSLRLFFGVAAVVTDVGHVLLIDLCLDDMSSNQDELDASDLEVMSGIPNDIPKIREVATREGRHLCIQLLPPSGTAVTTVSYISRVNLLAVGFSDGYLSLWNMKNLRQQYNVQIEGGRVPVYAVTFQEPENDPRNCCYLWAFQSSQSGGDVSLHLLQLAFGDRKRLASGQILYEVLEYCEERYSLDLSASVSSLSGQTNSTKLLGCQTIEKFRAHGGRDDGVSEVISPDTSVAIFCWQENTYGEAKPSIYLGVFDINRWYQAQMPDSPRPGQFLRNCSYLAFWSLEAVVNVMTQDRIFDVIVHERSLGRGIPPSYPPPEQFYYASTYSFDATCLLNSGIVHIKCKGQQKETLHFLRSVGPKINEAIPEIYNRCLVDGLLSPRLADVTPSSLSQEEQLKAILSAAVKTSSLRLLTCCIKQWTEKEQPKSSDNLRFVLEWTWNKVVSTKQKFDRLCIPLFDGSCNFIDVQTLQALQHCHLLLSNLTIVLKCFITEAKKVTKQGLIDLTNKHSVTELLTLYASVVLWFCRSGLLPDTSDETMQLTRPSYNYQLMQLYYADRRKKLEHLARGKWNNFSLMIDGMICQFGDRIEELWSKHEGGTGKYPPVNLHALLELYLLENADEMSKHTITIYFLLDIMYSFSDKPDSSIESFPTAFSVPIGLVKLIQGFWLLDHNDYKNSLDCILHPSACREMTWQHNQIIETLMCQGDHRQAIRYIQVIKPPIVTIKEIKLHMTVLLANKFVVEAWNMQRLHASQLYVEELLKHMYATCQEMGLMTDLLKFTFTQIEQEHLHKFLQTNGGIQNQELLLTHHLERANYIKALQLNQAMNANHMKDLDRGVQERAFVRNSIVEQYGRTLPRVQRMFASEQAKPCSSSLLVWKEVLRPKPLSTVATQANPETVKSKAKFISDVLTKIREVSVANKSKMDFSPYKSFDIEGTSSITPRQDMEVFEPFVGTPITNSQRKYRLLDSLVHPVLVESSSSEPYYQTPQKLSALMTSSPMQSSLRKIAQLRSAAKAPEFSILETPLVVRRTKTLAAGTASSIFAGFTPQSILRSSIRTTPLASPSVSPGRSVTPPLRSKETKISFMEGMHTKWTKGVIAVERDLVESSPEVQSAPEMAWSDSKVKIGSLQNYPVKGKGEMDEFSSGIHKASPCKMEVSKDASIVSARSDQTTLEYHDAPTPEDFEDDVITINTKPLQLSFKEDEKMENVVNEQAVEIQQVKEFRKPEEKVGKEAEVECILENGPKVLQGLTTVKEDELEPVIESVLEPAKMHEDSTPSVETGVPESESVPDSESVISIHDSEDIESLHSENVEDAVGQYSEVLDTNVLLIPQESAAISSHSADTPFMEEDKEADVQVSKPESEFSHFKDMYPAGTAELECNIENMEHHYSGELPDARDSDDSEGEHFIGQNNFTLVLENDIGEEEEVELEQDKTDQSESATLKTPPKVSCTLNQENVGRFEEENVHDKLDENVFTVVDNVQQSKILETLPYVPEPVKVSIKENLLDAIMDMQSKNFTGRESVYDNEPVRKLRNSRAAPKLSVKSIKHVNTEAANLVALSGLVTPPKTDEPKIGNVDAQQILSNEGKSNLVRSLTPRRSIRKSLKLNESTSVNAEETALPTTAIKVSKNAKENKTENLKNELSEVQEEEILVSTRRIYRRARKSVLEKSADTVVEQQSAEEALAKPVSTPTSVKNMVSISEVPVDEDEGLKPMVATPLTPTRARRGKTPITEVLADENLNSIVAAPVTPTRTRRGKTPISEVLADEDLNSIVAAPLTPTRTRRGKTPISEVLADEDLNSIVAAPVTPTRTRRGKTPISKASADEDLNTIVAAPLTPTRTRRGKTPISEASADDGDLNLIVAAPLTPTRAQKGKTPISIDSVDYSELNPAVSGQLTPTTARRGITSEESVYNKDGNSQIVAPLTSTRITRSQNVVLEGEKVTQSQEEETEPEHQISTPTRGRQSKRVVNELVKHFELNASQSASKAEHSPPVSPKRFSLRRTMNISENQGNKTTEEEYLTAEQNVDTPMRRSKSTVRHKIENVESTGSSEITILESAQEPASILTSVNKTNKKIKMRKSGKGTLSSVSEESGEEQLSTPPKSQKRHNPAATKVEVQKNTRITRIRSSNLASSAPDVSNVDNSSFVFSIPTPRRSKKAKAHYGKHDVEPESQTFVFSPPVTRTRRLTRATSNEPIYEKGTKVQKLQDVDETNKIQKRPRGRPPKANPAKMRKLLEMASCSPPPVEIQLLSPPESPAPLTAATKTVPSEAKVSEKNPLRRNRRRLLNLSKPVTRRKMR